MSTVVDNLPIHQDCDTYITNVYKKEFLSVLKPFDWMQAVYILSMYRVRNGFIIPNSVLYNVVSGIWSLLSLICYFFSIFKQIFTAGLEGFNYIKCFNNIPVFLLYSFGNLTNFCTNVIHRQNNVRFVISIQNICEFCNVNGKSLKNYMLFNWVYVIALIGYRVFWITNLNISFSSVLNFYETITSLFHIIFDIKILYHLRLMKLLSESLKIWVDDAQKLEFVADTDNESYWDGKFNVFMEIVEIYEIVEDTFRTLILHYCIDTFMNGVLGIWLHIELTKVLGTSLIKVVESLISLLWMVKNMLLISALCFECERFYSVMTEVRTTCIQLTASETCSEAQKRTCKNIERVQTTSIKKMSACGLFVLDGELPLLLLGLLTTFIIVVLQFEFL